MRNKKLIIIFSVLLVLTVFVVLSSVVFSVKHINAQCFNGTNEEAQKFEELINENSGIKKNANIFTLDKEKVESHILSVLSDVGYANVRIVNIEKKFPNTVNIHFYLVKDYFYINHNETNYYISNDLIITAVKKETEDETDKSRHIKLITKGIISDLKIGDTFTTTHIESYDERALQTIAYALSRLQASDIDVLDAFEFIDLKKSTFVYFKTKSGMYMEFHNLTNFLTKLSNAVKVYATAIAQGDASIIAANTTLIISTDDKCSHSKFNRYENGV